MQTKIYKIYSIHKNYNKYGYVLNNPLMFNDPSGEFIWFLGATWAAAHVFLAGVITAAVIGTAVGFGCLFFRELR